MPLLPPQVRRPVERRVMQARGRKESIDLPTVQSETGGDSYAKRLCLANRTAIQAPCGFTAGLAG
jgi:hypothetical protein